VGISVSTSGEIRLSAVNPPFPAMRIRNRYVVPAQPLTGWRPRAGSCVDVARLAADRCGPRDHSPVLSW
jgi:hypothetical protein